MMRIITINNRKITLKMGFPSINSIRFIKHSNLADAFGEVALFIDGKYWGLIRLQSRNELLQGRSWRHLHRKISPQGMFLSLVFYL